MKMLDNRANDKATINTDVVSFCVPQHPRISTSHTLNTDHAGQENTSRQGAEYDFILEFLNDLKPFAIRIQETIMPDPLDLPPTSPLSAAPTPDATTKATIPSFATRRAACTHLTVERLYGDYTCNVCSRSSNFGWVYCCTQDDVPVFQATLDSISDISSPPHQHVSASEEKANGVNHLSLPPSAVNGDPRVGGEDAQISLAKLNPWVEKAIEDGHYTPEQVVKLRAQKQHVVDTARAAIDHFEQSQTSNTNTSPQTPTTLPSVDANPHLPYPIINEVQEPPAPGSLTANVAVAQRSRTRMFPFCRFCACQLCRPTHRDRAWQCFDDVFEKDLEIPFIHYEDSNRPLASVSIMSRIGLCPPLLPKRPNLRSLDSSALCSRDEGRQVIFNKNNASSRKSTDSTSSSTDVADMKIEAESNGFRESMKRAFKGMLATRRDSSHSNRKRKAREGRDSTGEDAVVLDMGLWKELNDELLQEAPDVPLREKDSVEGMSKEVAEMGLGRGVGGVAVMEEAADLGTADVIMSV